MVWRLYSLTASIIQVLFLLTNTTGIYFSYLYHVLCPCHGTLTYNTSTLD